MSGERIIETLFVKGTENRTGKRRLIGIDGGGTKTACMIGDENGTILAICSGPSSSIKSRPWEEVRWVLSELVVRILDLSHSDLSQLDGVFLGLAGADRQEDKERLFALMHELLDRRVKVTIHNDAITALAAGTWGEAGIVLISGTGSIAYGYLPESDTCVRVGGWGYLLGDEGSGYDIGRRTLTEIMKQHDGRGKRTALTERVLKHWSLPDPNRIITYVYGQPNMRTAIADLAKLTIQMAQEGDEVAAHIVHTAVEELAGLAITAKSRLPAERSDANTAGMTLVLSGGLFADDGFINMLLEHEGIRTSGFRVKRLTVPPVTGCYLLALKQAGIEIDDTIKQRIGDWERSVDRQV